MASFAIGLAGRLFFSRTSAFFRTASRASVTKIGAADDAGNCGGGAGTANWRVPDLFLCDLMKKKEERDASDVIS